MSREEAFEILWNKLEKIGGYNPSYNNIDDNWLLYEDYDNNFHIHLCRNGDDYEYQVYIESNGSLATIDIQVLLEDIEDHAWCWYELNKIGIEKSLLGVK